MKKILFTLLMTFVIPAYSGSLCSFTNQGAGIPITAPTQKTRNEAQSIIVAMKVPGSAQILRGGPIKNAAAYTAGSIIPGFGRVNVDTILYNPNFLNNMDSKGRWAATSVLAHEIGHFLGTARFNGTSWGRELGADFWSGCALSTMGVSYQDATVALRSMFNSLGSQSHPDTPSRLNAMHAGYKQCR